MALQRISALAFDVYGTLIDTSDSSIAATREILARSGNEVSPTLFYARWKRAADELRYADKFYNIRTLLAKSLEATLRHFGLPPDSRHINIMFDAIKRREAFPEVADVCRKLGERYELAIVSNADDELLSPSIQRCGVEFDQVTTSELSRAYKPNPKIFRDCLEQLGCRPSEVLLVGNSIAEDVEGAKNVGIPAVWVNRNDRALRNGAVEPDYQVRDLTGLLDILP